MQIIEKLVSRSRCGGIPVHTLRPLIKTIKFTYKTASHPPETDINVRSETHRVTVLLYFMVLSAFVLPLDFLLYISTAHSFLTYTHPRSEVDSNNLIFFYLTNHNTAVPFITIIVPTFSFLFRYEINIPVHILF